MVGTTVDIGVEVGVVVRQSVNDRLRFLRRGGIVEIDESVAVHLGVEDGELGAYVGEVHLRCFLTTARMTKKATTATKRTMMMMESWWL